MLARHGREVTFVQLGQDPTNSDYPWEGASDPAGSPESTLEADAVFVPPASREKFGIHVDLSQFSKRVEQIMIVSPGESFEVTDYHVVEDGSKKWRITFADVFKPGDQVIFAFVGVRR